MAMSSGDIADFPATFTPSQKGTPLLVDENNHKYRIHHKNIAGTIATYRCVLRNSKMCPATASLNLSTNRIVKYTYSHAHSSQLLKELARTEEKKLIAAAVAVGRFSTKTVCARIKMNIERGDNPEAATCVRKANALAVAINREKKKVLGVKGKEPSTVEDIKANLLERFKKTSTGGVFLR